MEKDEKVVNKNVETFTDDMVKVLEGDKGGLIKKIIQEEEEHEVRKNNLSPKSKKNRMFMLIGTFLIILASGVVIFFVFFNKSNSIIMPTAPVSTALIFTDKTEFKVIDGLNKDKIAATVFSESKNTKVKTGGIEGIYLTEKEKVIGFKSFMTLLKGNFPEGQYSMVSDNFLLGSFNTGLRSNSPTTRDFFILLKVRSFPDIFPAMHTWENKMLYDLFGFFGVEVTADTNYLFTKDWQDGIVQNKNARILYGNDGKIVLMYVFINDSNVIITNSEEATNEVILRLNSSKVKK